MQDERYLIDTAVDTIVSSALNALPTTDALAEGKPVIEAAGILVKQLLKDINRIADAIEARAEAYKEVE